MRIHNMSRDKMKNCILSEPGVSCFEGRKGYFCELKESVCIGSLRHTEVSSQVVCIFMPSLARLWCPKGARSGILDMRCVCVLNSCSKMRSFQTSTQIAHQTVPQSSCVASKETMNDTRRLSVETVVRHAILSFALIPASRAHFLQLDESGA